MPTKFSRIAPPGMASRNDACQAFMGLMALQKADLVHLEKAPMHEGAHEPRKRDYKYKVQELFTDIRIRLG